jgi:hypothetical protein
VLDVDAPIDFLGEQRGRENAAEVEPAPTAFLISGESAKTLFLSAGPCVTLHLPSSHLGATA